MVVLAVDGQLEQLVLLVLAAAELETKMVVLEALALLILAVVAVVAVYLPLVARVVLVL